MSKPEIQAAVQATRERLQQFDETLSQTKKGLVETLDRERDAMHRHIDLLEREVGASLSLMERDRARSIGESTTRRLALIRNTHEWLLKVQA